MKLFSVCLSAIMLAVCLPISSGASPVLEITKMAWDVMKDGSKVTVEGKTVNAIPKGSNPDDFSWSGPASYTETYTGEKTLLGFDTAEVVLTLAWLYDGKHIANFRVDADSKITLGFTVDIRVETDNAYFNGDGIVELPYRAIITWNNKIGNTSRTTYKGVVRGDGLGRSGL